MRSSGKDLGILWNQSSLIKTIQLILLNIFCCGGLKLSLALFEP